MHFSQINLGTAKNIVNLAALPTGATTYTQGTLILVNGIQLYRATVTNPNFTNPAHYELLFNVKDVFNVAVKGGSSATVAVGTSLNGYTVALNDVVATDDGKLVKATAVAPSTVLMTLEDSIVVTDYNSEVYAYRAHDTTYLLLSNPAASYPVNLTASAAIDYTMSYQAINADAILDVSLMSSKEVRSYAIEADGADIVITLNNGSFKNNTFSPMMAVVGSDDTITILDGDYVVFNKVDATTVVVSYGI